MSEHLYFAYGSNMNLDQMAYRCPGASVVGTVRVDNYRLAFCGNNGVATILPERGSHVDGVLWCVTDECLKSLDRYEGYPHLYGKEKICVYGPGRIPQTVMVYTMNEPYRSCPALPSKGYLYGILQGCRQNGVPIKPIQEAVQRIQRVVPEQQSLFQHRKKFKFPER